MKKLLILLCSLLLVLTAGCSNTSNNLSNSLSIEERLLKASNKEDNFICSPLSVKSMLKILEDSSEGETKKQISSQLQGFVFPSITSDERISITNGLFIKDSYQDSIKDSYKEMLNTKYNTDIIVDSFNTPDNVNAWIKDKTFNLIDNAYNDISNNDFILANSLAIDLEWINYLQKEYHFHPFHIADYPDISIYDYEYAGPDMGEFYYNDQYIRRYNFGCAANKYDLLNNEGEDNIREIVYKEYSDWYYDNEYISKYYSVPDVYIEEFINELKTGDNEYGYFNKSTDFSYYTDDDVKVFAKDLKEHNEKNLEYIAILPKNTDLYSYIDSLDIKTVLDYETKLINPTSDTCEEGYITLIHGTMPEFDFDSSLDLKDILTSLNITDIFDHEKALLTEISNDKPYITSFENKTNISLNNYGIKAASVSLAGGLGQGGPEFDHLFEVPIIDIDLNFDKPFLFFIIDKDTKDIWFEGTVYYPHDVNYGY